MKKSFPETLKQYRETHGLTQQALAALLGVSKPAVEKWEAGTNTPRPLMMEGIIARLERFRILDTKPDYTLIEVVKLDGGLTEIRAGRGKVWLKCKVPSEFLNDKKQFAEYVTQSLDRVAKAQKGKSK